MTPKKKPTSRSTKRSNGDDSSASPVRPVRQPAAAVKLRLYVAAGGRCEFPGCNAFLLEHDLTQTPGNYAEMAHVVAFKEDGPRGLEGRNGLADINGIENLMLLCQPDHKRIDDHWAEYPVAALREAKREHEQRIRTVTGMGPELRTTVVELRACIGGHAVDVPPSDIRGALLPRYPAHLPGALVDLTGIRGEGPTFFAAARDEIRAELRPVIRRELETKKVQHYSIFGLAPIPVLMTFGRELGDKVVTDVFQRHRDQTWRWRDEGEPVGFETAKLRTGTDVDKVALILSVSGKVMPSSIPDEIDDSYSVYEITPHDREPSRELLCLRQDLVNFRRAYRDALARIAVSHDGLRQLHVFPAVPAPIAIACGQEVLPKAHPALRIYDNVGGRFTHAITINNPEDL